MATIARVYLRRKEERKWFIDIANKIHEEFEGIWESSEKGYVWTHKQHEGKVRFMVRMIGGADEIRIWHPSTRNRFKQAQAVGDFIQWIHEHGREYVRRILIFVPQ
jgi:hypothetical protein